MQYDCICMLEFVRLTSWYSSRFVFIPSSACDCRLVLLWSFFLYKSFKESLFGGWSWSEAISFTNPWEKLVWGLEMDWCTFLYKSFEKSSFRGRSWFEALSFTKSFEKGLIGGRSWFESLSFTKSFEKGLIAGWSWFDAPSFTNPLGEAWLEAAAVRPAKGCFQQTVSAKSYDSGFQTQF